MKDMFNFNRHLPVIIFFLLLLNVFSCKAQKNNTNRPSSTVTLKGTLDIDSEDRMILTFEDDGESKKIHLIPKTDHIKDFTLKEYDRYIYLKNIDESFWISVEGSYTTSDASTGPPQFIFHFIALLDEKPEAGNSSQQEK